jgi:hypothetical protein
LTGVKEVARKIGLEDQYCAVCSKGVSLTSALPVVTVLGAVEAVSDS